MKENSKWIHNNNQSSGTPQSQRDSTPQNYTASVNAPFPSSTDRLTKSAPSKFEASKDENNRDDFSMDLCKNLFTPERAFHSSSKIFDQQPISILKHEGKTATVVLPHVS